MPPSGVFSIESIMIEINIGKAEITFVFNQLDEESITNKLTNLIEQLGVNIMSMADKVAELEASLVATATAIEGLKVVVSAEALEVNTRIAELVALVGGITPGTVMTEAKLDEILATAKTLQTSAEGLTKAVEAIYVPAVTPPALATDLDGNFIAMNGDIVKADGTVRYAVVDYTTDAAGHHFDMLGNLITPSSNP